MTVVINEMDVVAPRPEPAEAPDDRGAGPSTAELEHRVERVTRERRDRAQRLRAY